MRDPSGEYEGCRSKPFDSVSIAGASPGLEIVAMPLPPLTTLLKAIAPFAPGNCADATSGNAAMLAKTISRIR
jgi:hypothetical protein